MADITASISNSNSSLTASVNVDKKLVTTKLASTETTLTQLGLTNVTNESKATMFTNPAFTGIPTAPTATGGTNTTQLATTAFVTSALSGVSGTLAGLTDTTITSIGNNELLVYDTSTSTFINKTFTEAGVLDSTQLNNHLSDTSNPHSVTSTTVGLERVSNLSPAELFSNPTFTGTVSGIFPSHIGLGNVDNTADGLKPVSIATQTALDLKAPLNSPTFTGTVSGITKAMVGLGNVENKSSATIISEITDSDIPSTITRDSELSAHSGSTSNPHSVTKTQVGLGNVDNTSDANKPVSSATQTALDAKQDSLSFGTGNLDIVQVIDSLGANEEEYARFTSDGIEGRSASEVKTDLSLNNVENKSSATIRGEIVDSDIPSTITRDTELSTHTSDSSNPHSVTKGQVGLSNVENKSSVDIRNEITDSDIPGSIVRVSDFNSHKNNESNPHSVTAAQTGAYTQTEVDNLLALQDQLGELDDVEITSVTGDDIIAYSSSTNKFRNKSAGNLNLATITVTDDLQAQITALPNDLTLTGAPHAPNVSANSNNTRVANTNYVDTAVANIVDSAPSALNTLNELAAALGDDANFAATTSTNIGLKLAKADNLSDVADTATARTNLGLGTSNNVTFNQITGTLQTAAQTNITSVGTLTNLIVGGQITTGQTGNPSHGLELYNAHFKGGGLRARKQTDENDAFLAYYNGTGSTSNFLLTRLVGGSTTGEIRIKSTGDIAINASDSSDKVGIGILSPTHKLTVVGDVKMKDNIILASDSSDKVGIGTESADRKLVIDGNVNIIKGDNHIANTAVLRTRSNDDTGTFIDFGGPVVVTHDLFKNSSVPGGFADNSNHFHTIQKIDRITAQGKNEVKNIERVEEQYYAIQSNNLRNDKAAFWNWHRITRAIGSTDLSLTNLVGWNVQADQDYNKTGSNPNGRAQTEQVPFSQSQNTIFTFDSQTNREAVLSLDDLIRVTVTTDFVGPFVAQTHFAKVTAVSGATATVVLYAGNYKTKDELPISTDAGGTGTPQTALSDTSTFSIDKIGVTATAGVVGNPSSTNVVDIDNLSGSLNESMYVTGTGITSRIQIQEVISSTQIKLSSNVTLSAGTDLSFRNDLELEATKTLTVTTDTTRATGLQKLVQFTTASDHGLEVNDTITIVTDGTGGFQSAEVAHVLTRDSATQVTCVYGRVFEPASNLALSTISGSSVVGVFKGTLDGIHRYTAGDQLMTFWSNNVGRYKGYQIGPGSQADGNCIAIGKNTYNKDANTIKIGYENNMLNIDSAGIDVAGTIDATGNITTSNHAGSAQLKASGAIAQLILEDSDNLATSNITNTGGDLYYTSTGNGTDYGNHAFMTKDTTTNNTKSAIMLIDGVNENVGIGTTTPDSYYALDVTGAIRASGSNVSSLSSLNITAGLTVDTNTLHVSAPDNKVAIGTLASGTSAKGKLTVHDTGASGTASKNRFFAISHGSNVNEYVSMYYQGTAGGAPFLISREDTGGAEMVFFNNGDINLNGGYKGITSSASTSKTPDNVGIGVNAATKLNNSTPGTAGTANTNGKPTNKLHIFEKSGLTMGALTNPNLDNATLRIEESTSTNVNMYLDGNSIYGTDILAFGTNTGKDISFLPGKATSLTLKSDGKVGIGIDAPTKTLDVRGSVKIQSATGIADTIDIDVSAFDVAADNLILNESRLHISGGGARLTVEDSPAGGPIILDADTTTNTVTISGDLTVDTDTLKVDSTNNRVGIGIAAPVSALHVKQNNSEVGSLVGITVENDGTGDATVQYLLTSVRRWVTGIDNSDSDKFKFAYSGNLATDAALEIDTSGNVAASGDIAASGTVTANASTITGDTLGKIGIGNSTSPTATLTIGRTDSQTSGGAHVGLELTGGQLATIKSSAYAMNQNDGYTWPTQDTDGTVKPRMTAAFSEDGRLCGDEKIIVKKVTGAEAKAMTTNATTYIELIPAPGANKFLVIRELEIFIDRGTWTPVSGGIVRGWGNNLLIVIETPAKTNGGVGNDNFDYNTYATFQKKFLNHTINNVYVQNSAVDTIIVRDAPATQTRAYPNKPLLLKPQATNTYDNLFNYSQTPDDDYYFRITYKILDKTTDFGVTTT